MDDLVTRLVRELPDTAKDRYDVAYQRGRAQARSSLLFTGLGIGLAIGSLGAFLFDPRLGRGRRVELTQRARALWKDLSRMAEGRSKDLRNRAKGAATELGLPGTPASNAERREELSTTVSVAPRSAASPVQGTTADEWLDHDESPVLAGSAR